MESDFSELLATRLPTAQLPLIRAVVDEAAARGTPLYAVGGLPRDLLLGRAHSDLDLVVEGDAIALARSLVAKYGGGLTLHRKFATARWALRGTKFEPSEAAVSFSPRLHSGDFLDLVSARSEIYDHPGALPSVRLGRIEDDLARRDFTINTLAVRLDGAGRGQARDDFGAIEDLKRGIVRVLHERSFLDDPTRMYRAVRYEQRFGFKISEKTLALIPSALDLVEGLSGHRLRHELDLILAEEGAEAVLSRLNQLNLLRPVHVDLPRGKVAFGKVPLARIAPPFGVPNWSVVITAWILWLMSLSQGQVASVQKRLQFTGVLAHSIRSASSLRGRLTSLARWRPSKCVVYLDKLPPVAVYAVCIGARAGRSRTVLQEYLAKWRLIRPTTTGKDLRRLGLVPGPQYKSILRVLRDAWIDGGVSSAEEEGRLLRSILSRQSKARSKPAGTKGGRQPGS